MRNAVVVLHTAQEYAVDADALRQTLCGGCIHSYYVVVAFVPHNHNTVTFITAAQSLCVDP